MKRWLMVAMVAFGCGTAEGGPVSPGDAGALDASADAGRSVARWQNDSAGQWRLEMGFSATEMRGVIERGSPNDFNATGVEMFWAAMADYGAARRSIESIGRGDAAAVDRPAMIVAVTVDRLAPAFCRAADAFRLAALGHPLMQPEPRVRCSELPVSDASRWWERWP